MKRGDILRSIKIYASYMESNEFYTSQFCYLPLELLHAIEAYPGQCFKLNYDDNKYFLLKAVPQVQYFSTHGIQCIVNGSSVIYNNEKHSVNGSYINKFSTISLADIIPLSEMEVSSLDLEILVNSVESTLKYRENKCLYIQSIKHLLEMYSFSPHCTINCENNALAKLIGVSKIIVRNVNLANQNCKTCQQDFVCKLILDTYMNIMNVYSIDRHINLVKKYDELGGVKDVLDKIRRLILEPWKKRKLIEKLGAFYPSGLLLVGPPGCGKTSLVRQICAETDSCLLNTTDVDTENMNSFHQLVQKTCTLSEEGPCILFLDEVDSLCPIRSEDSSYNQKMVTTQILLSIDKCKEFPNLLLVAATNRPYAVDPALRASGRFGIEVLLNMPNLDQRKEILAIHLKPDIDKDHAIIHSLALKTPAYVGADLQAFCEKNKSTILLLSEHENHPESIKIIDGELSSTVPSFYKTLDFITAKPKLTALGGLNEVKQQLHNVFKHHLELGHLYTTLNLSKPRGVLLVGPRGCGKTRLVASMAHSQGCAFLSANASHIMSPYVGESEKKIASLFYTARLMQPSILFIDEIDGIFGSRSGATGTVKANLIMEFLQAMDGAYVESSSIQGGIFLSNKYTSSKDEVLVCAATNNPEELDSALLRPGRFDKVIYVGLPDAEACLDILTLKTTNMEWDTSNLLHQTAQHLAGWTGAEIENFVMQVASKAILAGNTYKNKILLKKSQIDQVLMAAKSRTNTFDEIKFKHFMRRIKNEL